MARYTIVLAPNVAKVNIRADHSKSALDIGDFLPNQSAEGDELYQSGSGASFEQWLHISKQGDTIRDGWICIQHPVDGKLCILTDNNPPAQSEPTMVEFSVLGETEVWVTPPNGVRTKVYPLA